MQQTTYTSPGPYAEYSLTTVACLPLGIPQPEVQEPEANPWFVLHTLAEGLRLEWQRALEVINRSDLPAETRQHAAVGVQEAQQLLPVLEGLAIVPAHEADVTRAAKDTLTGLASATGSITAVGDYALLASWLAGQPGQLRNRLDQWRVRLSPAFPQVEVRVTFLGGSDLSNGAFGGWVA